MLSLCEPTISLNTDTLAKLKWSTQSRSQHGAHSVRYISSLAWDQADHSSWRMLNVECELPKPNTNSILRAYLHSLWAFPPSKMRCTCCHPGSPITNHTQPKDGDACLGGHAWYATKGWRCMPGWTCSMISHRAIRVALRLWFCWPELATRTHLGVMTATRQRMTHNFSNPNPNPKLGKCLG